MRKKKKKKSRKKIEKIFEKIFRGKLSKLSVSYYVLITTRTYETSESCDRVHLGHLKKKNLKKKIFEKKKC